MTTAVLSPLRKQGDVSKDPTAPTTVPQGSSAPATATTSHEQGSDTSPTATTACTYGSGSPLLDTLAHCYTPMVHLDPLLTSIKGRSRALVREGGRAGEHADAQGSRPLSLSPSRTLVTPYCKSIHPGRRTTRGRGFPLLSPPCVPSRADPFGLGHARQFTRRSRDPPGSKRRHHENRHKGKIYMSSTLGIYPMVHSLKPIR
jgi:hypothetical protein